MRPNRREEVVDGVILVLVSPDVMETLVELYHLEMLIGTSKLGGSPYIIYHDIIWIEEEEPC